MIMFCVFLLLFYSQFNNSFNYIVSFMRNIIQILVSDTSEALLRVFTLKLKFGVNFYMENGIAPLEKCPNQELIFKYSFTSK